VLNWKAICSPMTTKTDDPRYLGVLRWTLYVIAILSFAWPVYRAFLNVEIQPNEGWNAYFADAAMGKMPLYPSADKLITNNYPPLSFYIVGVVGRFLGDPVLAGRLLSLLRIRDRQKTRSNSLSSNANQTVETTFPSIRRAP
jgi:hypothetical protein